MFNVRDTLFAAYRALRGLLSHKKKKHTGHYAPQTICSHVEAQFTMKATTAAFFSFLVTLPVVTGCLSIFTRQIEVPNVTIMPTLLDVQREDGARRVNIHMSGSLQNPAWSPDNRSLLFTRFNNGYNVEPADLFVVGLNSESIKVLISDGSGNVNLPGSSWNLVTRKVVFSSSREPHDEIYLVDDFGSPGDEFKITDRTNMVAYEPSLSPDGQWVVFESHNLDVQGNGTIVKYKMDGTMPYQSLTNPDEDSRQPNWSPAGDKILYQKLGAGQWDVWIMNSDGTNHQKVTSGSGDKTDASFSPNGQRIVYSSNEFGYAFAHLFITSISGGKVFRLTHFEGYNGAPSWSSDGKKIAFESCPGDPDNSSGTTLWIIDVPSSYQ
jgi:TolB protein